MIFQNYLVIIIFLLTCTFFGITLNFIFKFTKKFDEKLYQFLSLIVIGFGFFSLFLFVMGFFNIPLQFWLIFLISTIIPIVIIVKSYKKIINFRIKNIKLKIDIKNLMYQVILVIIIAVFFTLMLKGTFSYKWLEDDDPWAYASGAKYVSEFKTYKLPSDDTFSNGYLFPNGHCMITAIYGVLNQVTPDMYFIMKFFINLFLTLGIISFFLFCYLFSEKNHLFSIIAVFILTITPCFAGHFIFNYTLSIPLFLVFLFSLSIAFLDNRCLFLSGLMLSPVLIAHPTMAVQGAFILFILLIIYSIIELKMHNYKLTNFFKDYKKSKAIKIFIIGVLGIIFSMFFYADFAMHEGINILKNRTGGSGGVFSLNYTLGSYDIENKNINDFFNGNPRSTIDQQIGVGIVLFSLCLLGILLFFILKNKYSKNNFIYLILFLFYFLFLWIFTGGIFRFSLQNYRWWSIFAIFIALHAAATIMIIITLFKKIKNSGTIISIIFLTIMVIGLIITSGIPRYKIQSSQWQPGGSFNSQEQLDGMINLRTIGHNKLIYAICGDSNQIIASNQNPIPWAKKIQELNINKNTMNYTEIIKINQDIIDHNKFEYILIDSYCIEYFGINKTNDLLDYYSKKYPIIPKYSNKQFFLMRVS